MTLNKEELAMEAGDQNLEELDLVTCACRVQSEVTHSGRDNTADFRLVERERNNSYGLASPKTPEGCSPKRMLCNAGEWLFGVLTELGRCKGRRER